MSVLHEYCSHCFKKTYHQVQQSNLLRRNVYRCLGEGCNKDSVQCRFCSHMARCGPNWDSELCAEHDGSIANFETLSLQFQRIEEYPALFVRRVRNIKRAATITTAIGAGSILVVPLALAAAPAVGGAIGATVMGLKGAAASSAGLAWLGGGSIAAGGAGMVGGAMLVAATGGAVGGVLGGVVSNAYFSDIEGFAIERIQGGVQPAVIVVDGFLTQGRDNPADWKNQIRELYPDNACYYLRWESKRLEQIGSVLAGNLGKEALMAGLAKLAATASKKAATRVGPLSTLLSAMDVAANPWHVAMVKAQETGIVLAEILARTKGSYVLCGHSLGARVIHYALIALGTKTADRVVAVHLMGGAVGNQTDDWTRAAAAVSGTIFNYHSSNDDVLRWLYSTANAFSSNPIGRCAIEGVPQVENVDVSSHVSGHAGYKSKFSAMARRSSTEGTEV